MPATSLTTEGTPNTASYAPGNAREGYDRHSPPASSIRIALAAKSRSIHARLGDCVDRPSHGERVSPAIGIAAKMIDLAEAPSTDVTAGRSFALTALAPPGTTAPG